LQKRLKTAFFMHRVAAKVHQVSLDFVPNQDFPVHATDSLLKKAAA
jgi:hypothetical protein